ncbi:MAG: hypothetical protein ABI665_16365 [Vicinamibacterales bacterium]
MTASAKASALVFVLFQALYALTSSGNAFRVPDEFEVYFQVEHLVDAGDLSVPQTLTIRQGSQSVFFGKFGKDQKPYAPYGPLVAVLALPHHLAGRALAALAGVPRAPAGQGLAWVILVGGVTMLSSATGAALAVAGFHRACLALATPPVTALVLALLLGGATVMWPYGATLYSEAWQAAALIWAAAFLLNARRSSAHARAQVIAAALLLALGGLVKVTCLIFAPAFVLAVLFDRSLSARTRRDVAVALVAGIALAVAVHMRWNQFRFGAPFDFAYDWAETIPVLPPRAFDLTAVPRGLVVLLLAPGKSLFLWAPALLLACAGARRFWRDEPAASIGIGAALGVGLLFYAAYLFPEGGYAHGPRNLVPIVPLLLLPAAGARARAWPRRVVWACAGVGATMALLATSVSFLEDQAMARRAPGATQSAYYDQIVPAPGRPANRYRLAYLPFITAMSSPGWSQARALGQGPDYFPFHMLQARRQLPDGRSIPEWIAFAWPAAWLLLLAVTAVAVRRLLPSHTDR